MKRIGLTLAALTIVGAIGGNATAKAADGILLREQLTASNYCHLKFPAMTERSLSAASHMLKNSSTGDVIDFYGSCDESPTGKDQVGAQRLDEQHRWANEYES